MIWSNYSKALSKAGGGNKECPNYYNYYDGDMVPSGGRGAVSDIDPDLMVGMRTSPFFFALRSGPIPVS